MKICYFCIITATALLCGCRTVEIQPVTEVTRTFNQPFDKVWGAVVSTMSADYPFQVIEKQSGVLQTQTFDCSRGDRFAYSPNLFLGVWTSLHGNLSLYVKSVNETNTSVRVKGHFEGYEDNVTHAWHEWSSSGVLENSILDRVGSDLESH